MGSLGRRTLLDLGQIAFVLNRRRLHRPKPSRATASPRVNMAPFFAPPRWGGHGTSNYQETLFTLPLAAFMLDQTISSNGALVMELLNGPLGLSRERADLTSDGHG